ncbi:MAG: 4-hydroxy-tetrahydrodipicolinate reductase [Ferruginibacter sp.]
MGQPLKIALIGYGKMGKAIETVAIQQGHEVTLKISSSDLSGFTPEKLQGCDVAIEFTNPESAPANIKTCIDAGIPVICGSTGWLKREAEIKDYCVSKNGALLYASNFSVGVNIFFGINKLLAKLMSDQPAYKVLIEEIHHTQKKDAPSGTAISLAEQIIRERTDKNQWTLGDATERELEIKSKREDPAPGTHYVTYSSEVDEIAIIHTARNRMGFANGAVLAAGFITGKKGIYTMADVLNLPGL